MGHFLGKQEGRQRLLLSLLAQASTEQVARKALHTWIQVAQWGLVLGLLGMGKYAASTSSKRGIAYLDPSSAGVSGTWPTWLKQVCSK